MRATIIGIEGGMGLWLKEHLTNLGYTVQGYDTRYENAPEKLREADLVVVSVPIHLTAETIKTIVPSLRPDTVLMEIASLKDGIHSEMTTASEKGIQTLCIHPMFGPTTSKHKDKTVIIIPVSDIEQEKQQVKALFPDMDIVVTDKIEHDRIMGIVLSLPYLINLAFSATLQGEDHELLQKLGGSTFAIQYVLSQSIVNEKTTLVESLIRNPSLTPTLRKFKETINNFTSKKIKVEDSDGFKSHLDDVNKLRQSLFEEIKSYWSNQ